MVMEPDICAPCPHPPLNTHRVRSDKRAEPEHPDRGPGQSSKTAKCRVAVASPPLAAAHPKLATHTRKPFHTTKMARTSIPLPLVSTSVSQPPCIITKPDIGKWTQLRNSKGPGLALLQSDRTHHNPAQLQKVRSFVEDRGVRSSWPHLQRSRSSTSALPVKNSS